MEKALSIAEVHTASAYWKRPLYLPGFLEHLINEVDEQLVKPIACFQAQLLIPGEKLLIMC